MNAQSYRWLISQDKHISVDTGKVRTFLVQVEPNTFDEREPSVVIFAQFAKNDFTAVAFYGCLTCALAVKEKLDAALIDGDMMRFRFPENECGPFGNDTCELSKGGR